MLENFTTIVRDVFQSGLFGIGIYEVSIAIIILITGFLFRGLVESRVINWLKVLSSKTKSEIDDVLLEALRKPLGYIPVALALYLITVFLPLTGAAELVAINLVKTVVAFTIFSAMSHSVAPIFAAVSATSILTPSMTTWLERAARLLIWIVGIGVILDIFGIQIGPLVAGLGLFSVAVALGAQDLFKNLISGILIIGENRFQPGDRIEVTGELHGIVETIGFRSTVIRSFDTAPMIIPNKDLSDVKVVNHGKMLNRRINWKINLTYSTTVEQLEKIRTEIKEYILANKNFEVKGGLDPVVKVIELGSSSIDILIVAYASPLGFAEFNELKEQLVFNIMKIVKANNSDFAFPSTSLYVESMP